MNEIHIVVKNTKTIAEYNELKRFMKQKAQEYYEAHKKAYAVEWKEGSISKVWIDEQKNLCIEYESGNWWHYNEQGEWW